MAMASYLVGAIVVKSSQPDVHVHDSSGSLDHVQQARVLNLVLL